MPITGTYRKVHNKDLLFARWVRCVRGIPIFPALDPDPSSGRKLLEIRGPPYRGPTYYMLRIARCKRSSSADPLDCTRPLLYSLLFLFNLSPSLLSSLLFFFTLSINSSSRSAKTFCEGESVMLIDLLYPAYVTTNIQTYVLKNKVEDELWQVIINFSQISLWPLEY